jgi:dCTP diphosphatase
MSELNDLLDAIRAFNAARDWDRYHTPKNLSVALMIEAAELAEIFQWMTEQRSDYLNVSERKRVCEEIGDVMIYLLILADRLGIDPLVVARDKLALNGQKYPVGE